MTEKMTENFSNFKTAVDALRRVIPDVGDELEASMEVGNALLSLAEHMSDGDTTDSASWNDVIYEIFKLYAGSYDIEPGPLDGFLPVGCAHESGSGLSPRHGPFYSGSCPECRIDLPPNIKMTDGSFSTTMPWFFIYDLARTFYANTSGLIRDCLALPGDEAKRFIRVWGGIIELLLFYRVPEKTEAFDARVIGFYYGGILSFVTIEKDEKVLVWESTDDRKKWLAAHNKVSWA